MNRWFAFALAGVFLSLGGCGGGSGGGSGTVTPPAIQNTQPLIVDAGPANYVNILFTSVTVCAPGASTNCQTIDHIQVDTGSTGLRIMGSVLSPALALPQAIDANGNPLYNCVQFVDGYSWGSVRTADVRFADERASSMPIQVIGDTGNPAIPTSCSSSGPPENTVATFGANGILGLGLFQYDCGSACVTSALPGTYYGCPSSGCRPVAVSLAQQLPNPVSLFATDNNGVIIDLPAVPAIGAATVSGTLIFGIGTQANNSLGNATVFKVDPNTGNLRTVFNNQAYDNSYVDAGSTAIFFGTGFYRGCSGAALGLYCPATTQNLSASLRGANGTSGAISFSVANADLLFANNPTFNVFNNLGAPNSDATSFDWGLPFFLGRRVYTALEGRTAGGSTGPFVAF